MEAEFLCLSFCFAFFSLILYPPSRERETDRERRPRRGFTKLDARSEDGSKTRKRPRRLSPAFLSQLRSGSHNQPSFCVFLLFFCSFLTLSAANITSSCTPTIITTTTTTTTKKQSPFGIRGTGRKRDRKRGNTDRPRISELNKIDINRNRSTFAMTQ